MTAFAAVDIGASGGRVMVGRLAGAMVELTEVHRFPNRPVRVAGTLHWDVLALYREVVDGLRAAGPIDAVGIDTWAVDYGLLDEGGRLLGNPVHYRDERTRRSVDEVFAQLPADELYARTGIQFLPFNTIFQLAAEPLLPLAERALLIPDLLCFWLTGAAGTELTNASTTALLDPISHRWVASAMHAAGVPEDLFPPLRLPGQPVGSLRTGLGLPSVPVYAVGSHDTASAVAAVPARGKNFGYVSSGTWSLVGVELDAPILTEDSRHANFTNELGVDGTVRYLRNVTGLWLLQECQRVWGITDVGPLLREAAALPRRAVVDADDPRFLPPGDMPARIAALCAETGQEVPASAAAYTRCVLDSLAEACRRTIEDAARLSGRAIDVVHIVGGGARNELLCQLTADACGRPVLAGPVEATALGNVAIQARAHGRLTGGLDAIREAIRRSFPPKSYLPC